MTIPTEGRYVRESLSEISEMALPLYANPLGNLLGGRVMHLVDIAGALAAMGCSSPPTNAQVGTGVGAVVGGAAGNVIFGGPVGTIGRAAAGALIGHEVGKNQPRR